MRSWPASYRAAPTTQLLPVHASSSKLIPGIFIPSYSLSSPWLTDRCHALTSQPGTLGNVPSPGHIRKQMEQPVWLSMAMVDMDLVDEGTEMAVPWEWCCLCSVRAGSTASLIPRAAH